MLDTARSHAFSKQYHSLQQHIKKHTATYNLLNHYHLLQEARYKLTDLLTPSLPQPVKFPGWKMHGRAYKQYIFQL